KHNAGVLAGYLAQWVDIGFQLPGLVKAIVAQFTKGLRAHLPLRDYLHLRMAEGMAAMSEELTMEAIHHFDFVLSLAEETDDKTDDYLTLGNIHSSYGRIARRQGRYQHAIDSFTTASAFYRKRDPQHRNIARSLNNLAYAKRLIGLQLRRKSDTEAARRRKAA